MSNAGPAVRRSPHAPFDAGPRRRQGPGAWQTSAGRSTSPPARKSAIPRSEIHPPVCVRAAPPRRRDAAANRAVLRVRGPGSAGARDRTGTSTSDATSWTVLRPQDELAATPWPKAAARPAAARSAALAYVKKVLTTAGGRDPRRPDYLIAAGTVAEMRARPYEPSRSSSSCGSIRYVPPAATILLPVRASRGRTSGAAARIRLAQDAARDELLARCS
jgi:hypothetical protein